MSTKNNSFTDILNTELCNPSKISDLNTTKFTFADEDIKRQLAVTAALELIRADLSASYSTGGAAVKGTYLMEKHMDNLSSYTDKILEAMKINDQ